MLAKIIAKITVLALRSKSLKEEQKSYVLSALLDNMVFFPIQDVIATDKNGNLRVNGKKLDAEQIIAFRESATALKESFARKIIKDQMVFKAINLGVHMGINTESIAFSKAVLWILQEENILIETLAMKEV